MAARVGRDSDAAASAHLRRRRLPEETRELVRQMARENRLWGAGRILREIAKLGVSVSRNTVRRYIREVRGPRPRGDQRWSAFIRNHANVTLAMDFAVDYVPSLSGKLREVFVLVLLEIGSRRLLCLEATENPTRDWINQKLREAIPCDHRHRFLVRDNDPLWGGVDATLASFGIEALRIPPRSPQANAFAERMIGTLRRELLDRIWPLGVRHLNRLLAHYRAYYTEPRLIASGRHRLPNGAAVVAIPHLGGLHHEYRLEMRDRAA